MTKQRFSRKIANYLWKKFDQLTDDELRNITKEIGRLNQSNCWWLEYRLKVVLEELAQNELKLRMGNKTGSADAHG